MAANPTKLPGRPGSKKRKARRYYVVALSVFLIGLTFSLFIWRTSRVAILNTETTRFDHYASMINSMISGHLDEHISALGGLGAFYNASQHITHHEWRSYVLDLDVQRHLQDTLGFAFVHYQKRLPSTRTQNQALFNNAAHNQHPDQFLVKYIEPLESNHYFLGNDLGAEPAARVACIDAVEQNQVTLSGRIHLKEAPQNHPIFLLLLPVYSQGAATATPAQRWEALQGWIMTPIRIDKLLVDIVENLDTPIDIELFDSSLEASEFLLFDADGQLHTRQLREATPLDGNLMSSMTTLEIGGRTWFLNILALPGFNPGAEHNMPFALLVAGMLLSLFAALLITGYGRHLDDAMVLTEKITADLRHTEQRFHHMFLNHDAVMLQISSDDGIILDANQAASHFYGYPLEELVGMPISRINTMPHEEIVSARQLASSGTKHRFEFRHRLASGEYRDVEVHSSPMVLEHQHVLFSIIHDITPRNRAQKALLESEELFRLAFETNPDPVVLVRFDVGTILDTNVAFEKTSGMSKEQTRGRLFKSLGIWLDRKRLLEFLARMKNDATVDHFEINFQIADETRIGLLSARRIRIKETDCMLASLRDITLGKKAERSLQEMNRMKTEFISTATHELRTPLSAIMGYSELLLAPEKFGTFSKQQKQEFLQEIYDHGETLTRLIDDLLDISRIESGAEIRMEFKETSLPELVTKTIKFFRIHDDQHLYRLELLGENPEQPCVIDPHRISQVLENLLGNALKFSPADSEIVLTAHKTPGEWLIEVADQGIGMSAEQVDRVFDKFYRVDASNTGNSGLGLGMSIVKKIVTAHNGTIEVQSTLGVGTRVLVRLPC